MNTKKRWRHGKTTNIKDASRTRRSSMKGKSKSSTPLNGSTKPSTERKSSEGLSEKHGLSALIPLKGEIERRWPQLMSLDLSSLSADLRETLASSLRKLSRLC